MGGPVLFFSDSPSIVSGRAADHSQFLDEEPEEEEEEGKRAGC